MRHTIEQMAEQDSEISPWSVDFNLANMLGYMLTEGTLVKSNSTIKLSDPTGDRLLVLETENKDLKEELDKLKQLVSQLQDTVEYKNWCSEGMPGLIKPSRYPELPLTVGSFVEIIGNKGLSSVSRERSGIEIGWKGTIIEKRETVFSNFSMTTWKVFFLAAGQDAWFDSMDLVVLEPALKEF